MIRVSARELLSTGLLQETMERALPLELSEESKRAWQTTRRAFECFPVASCDSFSTVYSPANCEATDEMDNLRHADTKLKELMEVPDESKDVIAGSDTISFEEAADDAR